VVLSHPGFKVVSVPDVVGAVSAPKNVHEERLSHRGDDRRAHLSLSALRDACAKRLLLRPTASGAGSSGRTDFFQQAVRRIFERLQGRPTGSARPTEGFKSGVLYASMKLQTLSIRALMVLHR